MITKFVLIVWIGSGNGQSISVSTFVTLKECDAVRQVLISNGAHYGSEWPKCVEYTF
jgi:hypothetical protein